MKIIRQKLFAKGVMGQLKKLESISRGLERAKKEAIEKGINPSSYDLVNKKRLDYVNAQGALLDKGVSNPDKVKVKHTKTVPLKDRTVRLTREERLAKWDPSKQYNYNIPESSFIKESFSESSLINKDSVKNKIESKRPGTINKYTSDSKDFLENLDSGVNKYRDSFLDKKLKEANDSLSSKDKRVLRKTIINEAKKAHIKPGNIKSSLKNDKDLLKYFAKYYEQLNINHNNKTIARLVNKQVGTTPMARIIPKNYDDKIFKGIGKGNIGINKNVIKKVQYGNNPKYSFTTAHEIGHLKNLKKGTIGKDLMSNEHFANNVGRSMKGNLGKTYDRFAKYQEDLYNQDINLNKFSEFGKKLLG